MPNPLQRLDAPIRWSYDQLKTLFSPRSKPLPAPSVAIDAYPTRCVKVNVQWIPHILGAIEALNQMDSWIDQPEESDPARQEILKLMENLVTGICEDGEQMELRFNECILEYSNDGISWNPVEGFDPDCWKGSDGVDGVDGINGNDGSDGSTPPSYTPPPILPNQPDTDEKYCGSAGYITERILDVIETHINQAELGLGVADIMGSILPLIPVIPPPFGYVAGKVIDIATSFIGLTISGWSAFFTLDRREALQCAIYCALRTYDGRDSGFNDLIIENLRNDERWGTGFDELYSMLTESYILAVPPESYSYWASIGSLSPSATCSGICTATCDITTWCIHMGHTKAGYDNNLWNYDHITPIIGTAYPNWMSEIINPNLVQVEWEIQYPDPMTISRVRWVSNLLQTWTMGGNNAFTIELMYNGSVLETKERFLPDDSLYVNTNFLVDWQATERPVLVDKIRFFGEIGRTPSYGENATRIITETLIIEGIGAYPDTMDYQNCGEL